MNIVLAWLWTIWRWSCALYAFGWRALYEHYRLLRNPHACASCYRQTLPLESFWECTQCLEYTLCVSCCGDARHAHEMVLDVLPLVVPSCHYTHTTSTANALDASLLLFHSRRCIGARVNNKGPYQWMTYMSVRIAAHAIGHRIASLTTPGDFAALLCAVTTEWVLADLACLLKGIPLVLLHRSTTVQQLCHVLASVRVTVIVASRHVKACLLQSLAATPHHTLRDVIWVDDSEDSYTNPGAGVGVVESAIVPAMTSHVWGEIMTAGFHDFAVASISPDSIVKLLPSSGTTGLPKLTVVTERMARPGVATDVVKASKSEDAFTVAYVYEASRSVSDAFLRGAAVGVFSGSLTRMAEDCQLLRPTVFAAVPAFWNGIHSQFEHEVLRSRRDRADVMAEWRGRHLLGNKLRALISTGAPISHTVQRWMCRVFGLMVINGYGTTETGGLLSNDVVASGVELRLLDAPELGFTTADKPFPRGEIVARSRLMSGGYYRQTEHDDDDWVTIDGVRYFRTGDIGEWRGRGEVRVIDRCKSVFKLEQGVFVAPEAVEKVLLLSPLVSQVFVCGNGGMANVAAVVVPTTLFTTVCELRRSFQDLVVGHSMKPWELPDRIEIYTEDDAGFTIANGLLSALQKQCRPALLRKFGPLVLKGGEGSSPPRVPQLAGALSAGLVSILQEVCPQRQRSFEPSDVLWTLGMDSLATARLSSRLTTTFGISLPPKVLFAMGTLAEIEAALFGSEACVRRAVMRGPVVGWAAEAAKAYKTLLDTVVVPPNEGGIRNSSPKHKVLLTGATGYLGAFLLRALLDRGEASSVVCIVRGDNPRERLRLTLSSYELGGDPLPDTVEVLSGNVSEEWLGLSQECYRGLRYGLTAIYHCAAHVSASLPFPALQTPNVTGTLRVLQLAWDTTSPQVELTHVSTLGFVPPSRIGTEDPESLLRDLEHDLPQKGGYAQSKWVAETLVWSAIRSGRVKGRVVRPGVIACHSSTGACNLKDSVTILLCGLVQGGKVCAEFLPRSFNMCHVDFVVESILGAPFKNGSVAHLCGSAAVPLATMVSWLRDSAQCPIEDVGPEVFRSHLRSLKETDVLFPFVGLMLGGDPSKATGGAHEVAVSFPQRRCPAANQNVTRAGVAATINFLRRKGFVIT